MKDLRKFGLLAARSILVSCRNSVLSFRLIFFQSLLYSRTRGQNLHKWTGITFSTRSQPFYRSDERLFAISGTRLTLYGRRHPRRKSVHPRNRRLRRSGVLCPLGTFRTFRRARVGICDVGRLGLLECLVGNEESEGCDCYGRIFF